MKKLLTSIILCASSLLSHAQTEPFGSPGTTVIINMTVKVIDLTEPDEDFHRTPPLAPVVFHDRDSGMLCFCNPCYDTSLELVIPGCDTVVFASDIPDGSETIELPTYLSGEYELRIIRGNWCFCGTITL